MPGKFLRHKFLTASLYGLLLTTSAAVLPGQENAATAEQAEMEEKGEPNFNLHLINTGIFAVIAGYAIWKLAPKFFNARSEDIQKAIKEATGLKMEADFRSSEIDRKMATLPDAVKKMRDDARAEMEREHQRREAETAQELKNIDANLASDIEGMRAEGVQQIRQRATRAAFWLAEQRLREQAAGETDAALVGDFVHLVEQGRNV